MSFLYSILTFGIVFGIIAMFHEVGHYIAARLMGVRVEIFSFGFGKRLLGKKIGGTDFRLSLIPLAGYVKMAGEEKWDPNNLKPDEFHAKNRGQKIFILFMGPAMNIIMAFLIFTIINITGAEEAGYRSYPPQIGYVEKKSPAENAGIQKGDVIRTIDGRPIANWEQLEIIIGANPQQELLVELERDGQLMKTTLSTKSISRHYIGDAGIHWGFKTQIQSVSEDSPAFHAGLKAGDIILAVNNEPISYFEIAAVISQNAGKRLLLQIKRGEELFDLEIIPEKGIIGVQMSAYSPTIKIRPGVLAAAKKSAAFMVNIVALLLDSIWKNIAGKTSAKSLAGPIEIASFSQKSMETGAASFFLLVALISFQFGLISLFPIYTLEGGFLMIYAIESVIRKDFSQRARLIMANTGFAILIALMVIVILNDIARILPEGLHSFWPF